MDNSFINRLRFYDGRYYSIDNERLYDLELKGLLNRYYPDYETEAINLVEELGSFMIDYSNAQHWSKEIPDIDPKSARLFTIWAEHEETKEVVVLCNGYFILQPFFIGKTQLREYYFYEEDVPYYPTAIFSTFRTIIRDLAQLNLLIDRVCEVVDQNWRELREKLIKTLKKNTALWKRYVFSFDKIVLYEFQCPSIDRELIDALKRKKYRMTGIIQLLASPSPSYDQITVENHLKQAKKIIENHEKEENP
ncbi:MAG: hypothetical protein ACFFC7_08435 [Candidatus Hermodarchaeota archaeon]